uniref:Thyroglobulin type-1 domain-containing protein n=1 Tax=Mola mola TaxID=94237 RepID=A0A3Q3X4L0_MOLML
MADLETCQHPPCEISIAARGPDKCASPSDACLTYPSLQASPLALSFFKRRPLHALLHGRGVCRNEKLYKLLHPSKEAHDDAMLPVPEYQTKVPLYGRDHISSRKVQAMKQAKDRKKQLARLGPTSNLDFSPLSLDKLEPEFGPCRRRLDNLIQSMKDTSRVLALSLYIPNCDKKGFFKRRQCKPSRGRRRGICWCVDRFGVKIPGISYAGGDLQCKDLESSSNSNE